MQNSGQIRKGNNNMQHGINQEKTGFTITCDKCGNQLSVMDKGFYHSDENIDIFPYSDCDGYKTTYTLNLYCKNDECKNEVEIRC